MVAVGDEAGMLDQSGGSKSDNEDLDEAAKQKNDLCRLLSITCLCLLIKISWVASGNSVKLYSLFLFCRYLLCLLESLQLCIFKIKTE